jgi:hypothetical protein
MTSASVCLIIRFTVHSRLCGSKSIQINNLSGYPVSELLVNHFQFPVVSPPQKLFANRTSQTYRNTGLKESGQQLFFVRGAPNPKETAIQRC